VIVEGLAVLTRELRMRMLNCSASGCLVEVNVPLAVSTVASLTVHFEGRQFTDGVLVAWCKAVPGGGARYHAGLRFVWTDAAPPDTVRIMAHQLVASLGGESGEQS
jgi:hypothetical protein